MFMVSCNVNLYYNKPTRCRFSESILFHCRVTRHVSGAFHTHHQEHIKLYLQPPLRSYYRCSYRLPTWQSLDCICICRCLPHRTVNAERVRGSQSKEADLVKEFWFVDKVSNVLFFKEKFA